MNEAANSTRAETPWHLWLIGVLGTLWNLVGAYDYLMTQTRNDAYMSGFTPEQLEYFYSFPSWAVAFWALAVWGAVLGTILLLLRKRVAATVLMVSFGSMVVVTLYSFVLSNGLEIMGGIVPVLFSVAVFIISLCLWLYARAMARAGVLA